MMSFLIVVRDAALAVMMGWLGLLATPASEEAAKTPYGADAAGTFMQVSEDQCAPAVQTPEPSGT